MGIVSGGAGGFAKPSQWTISPTSGALEIDGNATGLTLFDPVTNSDITFATSPGSTFWATDPGSTDPVIVLRNFGAGGGPALSVHDGAGGQQASGFLYGGYFWTENHTAPADAALAAGQVALWFDQTNGAGNTKLMLKGKSADGTVKTAAIVLA